MLAKIKYTPPSKEKDEGPNTVKRRKSSLNLNPQQQLHIHNLLMNKKLLSYHSILLVFDLFIYIYIYNLIGNYLFILGKLRHHGTTYYNWTFVVQCSFSMGYITQSTFTIPWTNSILTTSTKQK